MAEAKDPLERSDELDAEWAGQDFFGDVLHFEIVKLPCEKGDWVGDPVVQRWEDLYEL